MVVVLQQVFQLIQKVLSKWLNDAQVVEVTRSLVLLPAALLLSLLACTGDSNGWMLGDAANLLWAIASPCNRGVFLGCPAQHCCNHQHLAVLVHRLPQSALLLSLQELCHQQGDESWGYQMLVSPKGRALL